MCYNGWASIVSFFLILLFSVYPDGYVQAEVAGPGWIKGKAELISHDTASSYYYSVQSITSGEMMSAASTTSTTTVSSEIAELARALQYDPKQIYEYVHNHIDYVPYFGLLKGATLTYLDGSGNDFDQAALMVALLGESALHNAGIGLVQYAYGMMTIPTYNDANDYDMETWLGFGDLGAASIDVVERSLSEGGIIIDPVGATTVMNRVCVRAVIGGTPYLLDPAFKKYERTEGIDLGTAMGYNRANVLTAAGGTVGSDYVENLNDSGIRTKLDEYATNLIGFLRTNYPNASIGEIIGEKKIVAEVLDDYPNAVRFPLDTTCAGCGYFDEIDAAYVHTINIQYGTMPPVVLSIPEIAGKKLTLTYAASEQSAGAAASSDNITEIPIDPNSLQLSEINLTTDDPPLASGFLEDGDVGIQHHSGTIDFGRINNSSSTFSMVSNWGYPIANTAYDTQWIVSTEIWNNGSGAYSITSGGGTSILNYGQAVYINVRFSGAGQSRGTKTAEFQHVIDVLDLSCWDCWPSTYYMAKYLTGFVAEAPDPTGFMGLNFGQQYYNYPVNGTTVLENKGNYNLIINSITLTGTDSSRFRIVSGDSAGTLLPGESRNIKVSYLTDGLGVHNADIRVNFSYDGLSYPIDLPLIGETRYAPQAQLWLEDEIIAQEPVPISGAGQYDQLVLSIDHPYAGPCEDDGSGTIVCSGEYADQTSAYKLQRGSTYVIMSDFGGSKEGRLLKKRQRMLEDYRTYKSDSSQEVLTEAMNVMGQTWMQQTNLSDNLLFKLLDVSIINHHRFGIVAQEAAVGGGYYISQDTQFIHSVSRTNNIVDEDACFKASGFLGSALEHGVLEQLQRDESSGTSSLKPAASTIKLMYIANESGQKIYLADDVTDYLNNIKPNLTDYDFNFDTGNNDPDDFVAGISGGSVFVLPASGAITLNEWRGKGYIEFTRPVSGLFKMAMGMIIGPAYYGGYSGYMEDISVSSIFDDYFSELGMMFEYEYPLSEEPVNMTTGAYMYEHADFSFGRAEPLGLHLSRYYNSDDNSSKSSLGYGWTHSYDIYMKIHSDIEAGLAMRQPVDAAAMLASSIVTLDLMRPADPDGKEWMTAVLVGKWAMDRLFENAVSVHLQDKVLTYIKLPGESYNAPPGVSTQLVKNGDLYQIQERFGSQLDFNSSNKISSWTDVDGNTMTFTYNGDKLQTVRDAFNRTLTFNYIEDILNSISDSAGRSVLYGYTNDDLTSYTDPDNKIWGYAYNDLSNPHRMTGLTNPLSITTAINEYDTLGRVKKQTVPRQGGSNVDYNFYFTGFRNMEEDPDGYRIVYEFDDKERQVAQENALAHRSINEYDGQNHVIKFTDPKLNPTSFVYDGDQNLVRTTNALWHSTDLIYDSRFRLTDTIDPLYHGAHVEYDDEHHPLLSKSGIQYNADFQPQDNGVFQTSNTYYANGFPQTATDGRGTITMLTYDGYGNPDTTKVGAHPVLNTNYNSIGLLTSLTDQVNSTTSFPIYNNRGQLKKKTDPLLKDTIMEYDDAGSLSYIIDRNSQRIDYSYTPTSKLDTITYPNASSVHFTYNQHDDLTGMQDTLGATSYTYDATHRLTSITNPHGFVIGYSNYDDNGNLTELTYPGNKKVIYTYDALNRLETVKIDWLPAKPVATYYYDDAGRLDYLVNFNGTITDYGYDNANRLTAFENKKSDSSPIASYSFALDGNGNRAQTSQNEPFAPTPSDQDVEYTYNAKKNRLLTSGTNSFAYNDEGQLNTGYGSTYSFDYEHRLVTAGTSQYSYDGSGNRLQAVRNSSTTRYIYDAGGNLLAEADGSNSITKYFIHGLGLMAMVTPANQVYAYHFNAVGSTIAMTDSAQTVVNKYAYDPFGKVTSQEEDVNLQQPFKFIGQRGVMTEPNGFYYMRARYYDPEVGRFISEDPIGFDGGDVNLMAYADNNPVLVIDPEGEFGILGAVIGAGIELGVQMATNGGDWSKIDWADVGIMGAVGAVTPSSLGSASKVYKSFKATKVLSSQLSTAKAASKIAKLGGRIETHTGVIKKELATQGAIAVGKYGAKKLINDPGTQGHNGGK